MKILLTESQLKLITENYRNDSIIKMGLKDGDIMVKYKVWDYDNEKDNIFVDTYENFCVEVDLPKNDVVGYLKSKNLNLGNSRLVKELIRKEPKESDYFEFHRDENGKFYPEAFLGDYENYCGNDRECQNGVLRTASRVLNIVYKSEYPIVVYRGVKPNEKFDKHTHPGGYWTTKLSVAQGFGSVVYKGLIHKPEDIMILHTMENRMRWPEEFELSSHKVEIVEKYINNVKQVMGLNEIETKKKRALGRGQEKITYRSKINPNLVLKIGPYETLVAEKEKSEKYPDIYVKIFKVKHYNGDNGYDGVAIMERLDTKNFLSKFRKLENTLESLNINKFFMWYTTQFNYKDEFEKTYRESAELLEKHDTEMLDFMNKFIYCLRGVLGGDVHEWQFGIDKDGNIKCFDD